jgi:glycosyltransferase involved in cell wall biosynthesis
MRITIVEPFCSGSHAAWAHEYASRSRHEIELLTLPGRNWKWRMHGGAVTLASRFLAASAVPDVILATDMLDLTTFLALTREKSSRCRCAVYFHENQLTYPWSPEDPDRGEKRDLHYAFINYSTALAADAVLYNSSYHMSSFLDALPGFLGRFPDHPDPSSVDRIRDKSRVLPLGMELRKLDRHRPAAREREESPLILWNHRWEYDKAPEAFFAALYRLVDEGVDFRVAVVGESFQRSPAVFKEARQRLGSRIVQWGYLENFSDYAAWLWRADVLPVTSRQEFFGASVVQALYCNCFPLLPDRLSYPEHVPPESAAQVLYSGENSLLDRLRALVTEPERGETLRGFVARYDWEQMAPAYDAFFEKFVEGEGTQRGD